MVRPAVSNAAVVWFESYWHGLRGDVGGKAASLGEMTAAGLPVPPGFAITATAYERARDDSDLDARIAELLHGMDVDDMADVSRRCAAIREAIRTMPLPDRLAKHVLAAYDELGRRCGVPDLPVAVRSSATSEDSPDASFAGEHDTYLWVRGGEQVVDAVRRCWASLFTDRATCYRAEMGYDHRSAVMCVVVQKMVRPRAAGVAFTLDPSNGDRSQVAIDASWGFGEAVVSGEVTPDHFLVDKVILEIGQRVISSKAIEFRLTDHDTVEKMPVEPARATTACLDDSEIKAIARLAKTAERHYGCPQDIEWAVDGDLGDGENVILLQARPETVWTRGDAAATAARFDGDLMSSIVSTLMSPLHAKDKAPGGMHS
jgi:pyruvate, water dikinase